MARPKKHEQVPNLKEVIKEVAWQQMVEVGAAGLSLRAIARELGMSAPSIYNHYADRDALVTALIIDAYTSLGDYQLAARDAVAIMDLRGRWRATGEAYRAWAIAMPQRYQLIFGTPIPGYQVPTHDILPAGARSLSALVSVVDEALVAGRLNVPYFPSVNIHAQPVFDAWQHYSGPYQPVSLAVAMLIWGRVHGLVSLEIGGNMPSFGPDGAALYAYELDLIWHQFVKPTHEE